MFIFIVMLTIRFLFSENIYLKIKITLHCSLYRIWYKLKKSQYNTKAIFLSQIHNAAYLKHTRFTVVYVECWQHCYQFLLLSHSRYQWPRAGIRHLYCSFVANNWFLFVENRIVKIFVTCINSSRIGNYTVCRSIVLSGK